MGVKPRQNAVDLPKAEVGEIDTRAPFASVKAAVSLFGEVAVTSDRSSSRKIKPQQSERALAKETELHLAQKELNKYKEQLHNAETTRIQALSELERARKTVQELTSKLSIVKKSKELALKAAEDAKNQTNQLEDVTSGVNNGEDSTWKKELDSAREQYTHALSELDSAKQELRRIKKDFDTSLEAKLSAVQQEAAAKQLNDANTEKAAHMSKDIEAAQESLAHVKLATEQAQQEELKILTEKDAARHSHKQAVEETEKKLEYLKKQFDLEDHKNLEGKLSETNAEIGAVQKQIEAAQASDMQALATVTTELDDAKGVLQKVAEEECSLRSLVESLKLELEAVKKEHNELKQKDAETEAIVSNLHLKLQKCKVELEAASTAESKAASASDDLMSALEQLTSESKCAMQEAEATKKSAEQLRCEAEQARIVLADAEKKLQIALKEAEEAKAAEARALDKIKDLSEKANAARSSTSESGAKITISKDEYESLSRKVEESEKLTEMKIAASVAQVEAVRASENEAIKRLEAVRKEMEDLETATEEALKRAEMAEAAKKAVEGELKRWREKEQKKATETAARILAETQMSAEALPPKSAFQNVKPSEKTEDNRKTLKPSSSRKILPSFMGIFHKKSNRVDGNSAASYLPGKISTALDGRAHNFASILGSPLEEMPFTCHGVPIRDSSWKINHLAIGGRLTLINTVLSSLPTYFMSVFLSPVWVIQKIDKIRRRFLWGLNSNSDGSIKNTAKMEKVCLLRQEGGLGIRELKLQNGSLLGKWWRRLLAPSHSSAWKTIVQHLHFGEKHASESHSGTRFSHLRDGISKCRDHFLLSCFFFSVRNGCSVDFWKDRQCLRDCRHSLYPQLYRAVARRHSTMADLWSAINGWPNVFRYPVLALYLMRLFTHLSGIQLVDEADELCCA